jgi:hypothetical protein
MVLLAIWDQQEAFPPNLVDLLQFEMTATAGKSTPINRKQST